MLKLSIFFFIYEKCNQGTQNNAPESQNYPNIILYFNQLFYLVMLMFVSSLL